MSRGSKNGLNPNSKNANLITMKNNLVRNLLLLSFICTCPQVKAQIDGNVSAGFFDSSESTGFNYATFHLPPLSILFENAKANPQILDLAKAQEIAQAEVEIGRASCRERV